MRRCFRELVLLAEWYKSRSDYARALACDRAAHPSREWIDEELTPKNGP